MILHPAIIALLLSSGLVAFMVLYAARFGWKIIRFWDISSGSEQQLALERSTYLISTLLALSFVFQIASLFLYIYTADDLHTRFVGAMCAAGSLNVDPYGYPTFVLKILSCILAGLWLILNHVDNRAYDYPLIKKKYILLLLIVPFVVSEVVLQTAYFAALRPEVITSCCGSLFSAGQNSLPGDLAALPPLPMMIAFYVSLVLLAAAGFFYWFKGRGGLVYAGAAVVAFPVFVLSLLSFISLYFYELPTHHCPFCFLQKDYAFIGYPLYASLLGGVVCGAGVGLLAPFARTESLARFVPAFSRRLLVASCGCYFFFAAVSTWKILTANLVLNVV